MVPRRAFEGTPCFSATARYMAMRMAQGELMVMEVDYLVQGDAR